MTRQIRNIAIIAHVDRERLAAVCAEFVGRIAQVPPMHSALKRGGKPLYEYARSGIEVERGPREVTIDRIDVSHRDGDCWTVDVQCSKGTYIRTLAEDIGEALGCGAHLAALRRTASGCLSAADACTFDELEAMAEAERDALLRPADALLDEWPVLRLASDEAARFLAGMRRRLVAADAPCVRVYGPQPKAFLGTGHVKAGELISTRLLSPPEVQGLLDSESIP